MSNIYEEIQDHPERFICKHQKTDDPLTLFLGSKYNGTVIYIPDFETIEDINRYAFKTFCDLAYENGKASVISPIKEALGISTS